MNRKIIIILGFILLCLRIAAQPEAYDVIGGGSYCQGSGGLPIGLSNSDIGVTYTLIRDGYNQPVTLVGTGAAISFGNQLAGTYTISGTDINGTTPMTGSALITEKALPNVTFIVQPGSNICIGADAIYSTEESMVTYVWSFSGTLTTDYIIISGGTATSNTVTLRYLTPGIRTVNINYTNSDGCTAVSETPSIATSVNPLPTTSAIYHQ